MKRWMKSLVLLSWCIALTGCLGNATDRTEEVSSDAFFGPVREENQMLPETLKEEKRYIAYQETLYQLLLNEVYPEGMNPEFEPLFGSLEDNRFAVMDVNGNGTEELIIQFTTASMAENVEIIYDYGEEEETIRPVLTLFPALTYYENGIIQEKWAHGHDLSGEEYWPYNLYRYQETTGEYELVAEVNMWSRSAGTIDYKGDPYPEDIDAEKAGIVFILSRNGVTETVSKSSYEAWLEEIIGNAQVVSVPYRALTKENIEAINKPASAQ